MIKQIFVDTETTSPNTDTAGVYQVGGIIKVGKREEEFEFNCDIFEEDEISKTVFEKNGMSVEKISQFPSPEIVFEQFIALLDKYVDRFDKKDKFIAIGYGAEFDQQILRNWFYKLGDDFFGSWFWHPFVDVMNLAMYAWQDKRAEFLNFKLPTVAEYLHIRIDESKLHTALYDARIAKQIYDKLEGVEIRRKA